MPTATLCLHCPDVPGIVYRVTGLLFERGANIVHSSQHREELDDRFFLRVVFDLKGMTVTRRELAADLDALAAEMQMETRLTFSDETKKMAVMVSKYDHCLYDLLLRRRYGELAAEPALVISNHPDLEHVAESFRVPYFYVPVKKGKKREAEDRALELLASHKVDFVVMARYMQILTSTFIDAYKDRILNIHHGFLPAFQGAKPYHQAYRRGVKLIGATAHYATEDLDQGPIIEQETIRVSHVHTAAGMVALGRDIERKVLAAAVKAHAEDRIMVYGQRTIVFE